MANHLLLLLIAALFLGCATDGRPYNTAAIHNIEIGKTTRNEVLAMLGAPLSQRKLNNGIEVYDYTYAEAPFFSLGNNVDSLQLEFFKGVVIDKWQWLARN